MTHIFYVPSGNQLKRQVKYSSVHVAIIAERLE